MFVLHVFVVVEYACPTSTSCVYEPVGEVPSHVHSAGVFLVTSTWSVINQASQVAHQS